MSDLDPRNSSRTPPLQSSTGDGTPLIAVCSLLSRADNTPLGERSLAPWHVPDRDGLPIADSAAVPGMNGFEANANLNFEHWGEYWRKVHGVRFTHAEEAEDRSLDKLLRYDQLHRFAPGPTHTDAPPYRPPLDANGKLWSTVVDHVERYRRPRWDGIAYTNFASRDDIGVVLDNPRFREKIEPEDRAMFRDIAPVLARQYIVLPSATGAEAATLVKLHARAPGVTRDAFQQWWLREHAPLVAKHAGLVRRYVQLHNIGPTEPGQPQYHAAACRIDGVTLLGFASVNDVEEFLGSAGQREIFEDERRMTDSAVEEWWTAVGMVVVDRLGAERATRLDG